MGGKGIVDTYSNIYVKFLKKEAHLKKTEENCSIKTE
jgi:hypothetical protein